jgi:hypothetical protein
MPQKHRYAAKGIRRGKLRKLDSLPDKASRAPRDAGGGGGLYPQNGWPALT